jgi:RNA polymerase sigma-70 factor, ECF subfamily
VINTTPTLHSLDVGTRSLPRMADGAGKPSSPVVASEGPAFRRAFDDHARFVWRALLGLGIGDADVPDASQQVFVILHDRLGDLQDGCSLRTFVYGICLRVASDFRRRAHHRRERRCAEPPERSTGVSPEGRAAGRQALHALEAALDKLPSEQREVFVLFEIEDLPMNEIAGALACPLQTAYSRLRLARRAVAQMMGEHLPETKGSR